MRVESTDFRLTLTPPAERRTAAPAAGREAPVDDVVVDIGVPSIPPPELREQIRAAGEVAERLARDDRELHFHKDEDSGRVIVQVRDLEGAVIRTIPPSSALEMLVHGKGS